MDGSVLLRPRSAPPGGSRTSMTGAEGIVPIKIKNSLRSLLGRDRNNRLVRRKGRVFIINKKTPRYKARQG